MGKNRNHLGLWRSFSIMRCPLFVYTYLVWYYNFWSLILAMTGMLSILYIPTISCTIDLGEITKIFQEISLKNAKSIELVTTNTWGSLAVCIGQLLRNFVKTYTLLLVDIFINTLMQKHSFFEKMSLRSSVHETVECIWLLSVYVRFRLGDSLSGSFTICTSEPLARFIRTFRVYFYFVTIVYIGLL